MKRSRKVGYAFSDFVTEEKFRSGRPKTHGIDTNFLGIIPLIIFIGVFVLLSFRLFYLQVLRSDYFSRLSDENRTRTEIIPASRGILLDRFGRPLVSNSPSFKVLEGNKVRLLEKNEALDLLSQDKPVLNDIKREYLYKDSFAHVLGYIGQISEEESKMAEFEDYGISDFVGKMGLEKQYEKILHGTNGKELFEVDAHGEKIRKLGRQEPVSGNNITTTLDIDIQKSVYEAFKDVKKGAVVVSDPKTGGILALYSKPSFDPNLFTHTSTYKPSGQYSNVMQILTDTDNQPLLDRAISGTYPPGSTYKLVSATAALEEGKMKPDTIIEDTGQISVGGATFGNWYFIQYGRKEGPVDVVKAIARSNDIYFYRAAERTGIDVIHDWSTRFKLGEPLGIDLPHEEKGLMPSKKWKRETFDEDWYTGDSFNLGIGQGYLLATPLQINMMTSVFANEDGILYRPHLVEDDVVEIRKDFISQKNRDLVRRGMQGACGTGGTAYTFFNFAVKNKNLEIDNRDFLPIGTESAQLATQSADLVRVSVACKTGTAETGGKETEPHAWLTAFAPYNEPEIVVTVLVENGGEGSKVAGPITTEIMKKYFESKR